MAEQAAPKVTGCENCGSLRFAVHEHLTSFCTLNAITGALVQNEGVGHYQSNISDVCCEDCGEEYEIDAAKIELKEIGG